MLILEWRCSWSSADRQCSNYIWVINNFIANQGVSHIWVFTVCLTLPTDWPAWPHYFPPGSPAADGPSPAGSGSSAASASPGCPVVAGRHPTGPVSRHSGTNSSGPRGGGGHLNINLSLFTMLTHCPWEIRMKGYKSNFHTKLSDWRLRHILWNCHQMNVIGPYLWCQHWFR